MKTSIIVVSSMKSKSRMELNALNSLILYMCLTKSPENQSLYQRFFIVSIQCLLYVGTVGAIPLLIHISIGPQICKLCEILQIKVLLIYKSKWAQDIVFVKNRTSRSKNITVVIMHDHAKCSYNKWRGMGRRKFFFIQK